MSPEGEFSYALQHTRRAIKNKVLLLSQIQDVGDVYTFFGDPIAQSVEPHPFKVGVPGSSPGGITI